MNTKNTSEEFDYIIVGAGSAGCVLANRLTADPSKRVLLLEAGGKDSWIWFHIPVGYLFAIGNPRSDWCFKTEPEPGLNGRTLAYPRGKAIGGSSAINAMIYMRGQAADYDHWRQLGMTGWGWNDVLPLFMKHEDTFLGDSEHHATGGELRVEFPRVKWEILERIREAGAQTGIPPINDFNCGDNEGSCYFHVTQKKGRRWSAARGFLKPVLHRQNLEVETGVLAEKILFEGKRAVGIAYRHNGALKTARARGEVILAAGALGSPQLLMLSGVGPAEHLKAHGIPVLLDKPGVGENLQDHLQLRLIFKINGMQTLNERYHSLPKRAMMGIEYALRRTGPLTMAPSQLGFFTRSDRDQERANIQFHVQPLSLDRFGEPLHTFPAFTMSVCNLQPTSRGTIRLKSGDPTSAPEIKLNYLSTEEDRRVASDSIRVVRKVAKAPALAQYQPDEILPGPSVGDGEDELLKAAGDIGTTIFHPVGTAKMGLPSDPRAVVDERLRFIGIDGLRVIDASIMPTVTSGNTNAPTIMIGEKGAQMVIEDARK